MKKKIIWTAVDADEYELPIAVAHSKQELADMLGLSVHTVKSAVRRNSKGTLSGIKIIKIELDD